MRGFWSRGLRVLAALVVGSAMLVQAKPPRTSKRRKAAPPAKKRTIPVKKAKLRPAPPSGLVNGAALRPFLEALQDLDAREGRRRVRVMQFGDSHTAADYWSGRLRQRLQGRFGDGGAGLVQSGRPWRGYRHEGLSLVTSVLWPATSLRSRDCDGWVGLAGSALTAPEGETLRVQSVMTEFKVHLLGGDGAPKGALGPVPDPEAGAPAPELQDLPLQAEEVMEGQVPLRIYGASADLVPERRELTLALPPGARLLGVELFTGRRGVVVDELGLNGAELADLERWQAPLRRALLAQAKPDLLVLAYGTNDMGRTGGDPADYQARAEALFRTLRAESGAAILVVGPLDRQGRTRRQRAALREGAAWVARSLRQGAQAAGCAFWDARQAMGGEGAIAKWKRSGLAQRDLVHLTGAGYQRLGDLLAEELLKAWAALPRASDGK